MWNAVTVGTTDHSGYQFQANGGGGAVTGSTLPIRSLDKAELPGVLWDASSPMGLKRGTLHLGITGGVAESDLDIGTNGLLLDAGIKQGGAADLRSWSAGGFALLTNGSWYAGSAVGGSWGHSVIDNYLSGASSNYDVSSFTSAFFLGTVLPLADTIRFDVRSTLGYQRTVGEAHADTLGIFYGEQTIEALSAGLSARLFGVLHQGDLIVRPYLQAGLAHRLHYDNGLQIGGIDFTFDDASTSIFAAAGIDFEINETLQLSAGLRQEHSPDYDSLSGRFGIVLNLN
jgi:hypothetical protein